mmetsp:Transcript_11585/g.31686  ORF Transcript_11585/g.31686 Transcript_11585/m.31686 type:complete len:256 (-) Transcript_11585:2793-3560(-)
MAFRVLLSSWRFFSLQEATSIDTIRGVLHFLPSSSSRCMMKSSTKSLADCVSSAQRPCSRANKTSTRLLRHSSSSGSNSNTRNNEGAVVSQLGYKQLRHLECEDLSCGAGHSEGSSCSRAVATTRWLSATRPVMHRSIRGANGPASSIPSKRSNSLWHSSAWRSMKKRFVSPPYTMRKYQSTSPSASLQVSSTAPASPAFSNREQRSITGMSTGSSIVAELRQCIASLQSKEDLPEPGSPRMSVPWKKMWLLSRS